MKVLVVVDMQNDFIDRALGTKEAQKIIPNVLEKIKSYNNKDSYIIATRDTHSDDYLETEEGKNLPVKHCTDYEGWCIQNDVYNLLGLVEPVGVEIIDKPTFGSIQLAEQLKELSKYHNIESIELIGLCTDICVISNAVIAKSVLPNVPVYVDASCCAGVTPESHNRALDSMQTLQMHIENRGKEPWLN